jgi:hypothetical protein
MSYWSSWGRLARLLVVVVTAGLAGCATAPPVSTEAREVLELLRYYERLNFMSIEEQRQELTAAQAAFDQQSGEFQRLRLALVLALPKAPWRDDSRLLLILNSFEPPNDKVSERRELALLIQKLVLERQRIQREERALLRDERKKVDELQQKIEALRSIDRDIRPRKQKP